MSDETAPQPRIKISWLIGTLAAFALFMVIGAYSSRMTWDYTSYDQQRGKERYATLTKLRQDEGKLINPVDDKGKPTAEWIDQDKGVIRIPIEEAMAKEVDTLKAKAPQAESAIALPPPAPATGSPAPTAGATNAAPAKPSAPAAKTAAPTLPPANLNESKP